MKSTNLSPLQKQRYLYQPKLPTTLRQAPDTIEAVEFAQESSTAIPDAIKAIFPHADGKHPVRFGIMANEKKQQGKTKKALKVGVILSGGQAPGGHNVIAGIFDGIQKINPDSELLGFSGGPSGLLTNTFVKIDSKMMDSYRNTGGFDMIGSGRTKISTPEQFKTALDNATKNSLNALVIIGGDDSNTNAALLAEYFLQNNSTVQVIGVPKTIDGDLKNDFIETSFGFDTAVKTYSELIGNIARDANSAKKYWHFIKVMGRSASHIALECALQTQPNICLISEEVKHTQQSLADIVKDICEVIAKRAEQKENFGVIIVPEGLIEFIPEMNILIGELNDLLSDSDFTQSAGQDFSTQTTLLIKKLSEHSAEVFAELPQRIQEQLLMDRDPHGNVQVSRIETERLLISMVESRLSEMKKEGTYKGTFSAQHHFFGYEGRCAFPSNFDADYCYSLGYTACLLISQGFTGYISAIQNVHKPADAWVAGGVPLHSMMHIERRHGKDVPVIQKALVDLEGKPFKEFAKKRSDWAIHTSFIFPGAIQYYGPAEICDQPTHTLRLEHS